MSNSANLMSSFNFSSDGRNLAERSMSVCLFRVIKYCLRTARSVKTVRYME